MLDPIVAITMALLGFVVIGSQRHRYGMFRRAAEYLGIALIISISLVFTNHATDPEINIQELCKNVLQHSATATLFFVTSWLFSYLLIFKKYLEAQEEQDEV